MGEPACGGQPACGGAGGGGVRGSPALPWAEVSPSPSEGASVTGEDRRSSAQPAWGPLAQLLATG